MRIKKIFKKIGLVTLGLGAIGAVGMGGKALYDYIKNDSKTINLNYEVGALSVSDGKFVTDKTTLYTKNKFACDGLKATLDFDSTISYQLFYYDILDNYISSSAVLTSGYSGVAPLNGAYARVMITPLDDEDNKISLTERVKYGNMLNIKVSKKADNINDKFKNLNGNLFQVANSTSDLVFENGCQWDFENNTIIKDNNVDFSFTSKNILKIEDLRKITVDTTKFIEGSFTINLYQYDIELDNVSKISLNGDVPTYTFDKKVKYVLIDIWQDSTKVTDNDVVSKLQNYITLSKANN